MDRCEGEGRAGDKAHGEQGEQQITSSVAARAHARRFRAGGGARACGLIGLRVSSEALSDGHDGRTAGVPGSLKPSEFGDWSATKLVLVCRLWPGVYCRLPPAASTMLAHAPNNASTPTPSELSMQVQASYSVGARHAVGHARVLWHLRPGKSWVIVGHVLL